MAELDELREFQVAFEEYAVLLQPFGIVFR